MTERGDDPLWRARELLQDPEACEETKRLLVEAGFSIVADLVDLARAPAPLKERTYAVSYRSGRFHVYLKNYAVRVATFAPGIDRKEAERLVAGANGDDAARWRYGVEKNSFPRHIQQIYPEPKLLGWRMASQEPRNGESFDPADFPYYQTAEAAIDAEIKAAT